jgi:hypothetical protein
VLGLADRHQDNMLLLGHAVFAHIDFGYVAGSRPWPFDTGPFPIPAAFRDACAEHWPAFLNDVQTAYEIVQQRAEALLTVAQALATPLVGPTHTESGQRQSFATFLEQTLARPSYEVRQLAADGPDNWSTLFKEATYQTGQAAGRRLREVGVPV